MHDGDDLLPFAICRTESNAFAQILFDGLIDHVDATIGVFDEIVDSDDNDGIPPFDFEMELGERGNVQFLSFGKRDGVSEGFADHAVVGLLVDKATA